ncbi:unnamed protein product [Haemonchus placei]|uniref:DUF2470 domain-containing protein n=1 Tax=Haemonchus placei TaxID=6290 RepID=A0A0N4WTG9_HAEPC|nr:unnamed protein product [Haemonchus placei]
MTAAAFKTHDQAAEVFRGILEVNKEHLLFALSVCISQFKPPVPPDLVKVHFIELGNPTLIQREANRAEELVSEVTQDYNRPVEFRTKEGPTHHAIGNVKCPCEHTEEIMDFNSYLVVIEVRKSPDGTIYQNEEGCAYRRRYGSNKMIILNDIVALMSKTPVPRYLEHMLC